MVEIKEEWYDVLINYFILFYVMLMDVLRIRS